MGLVEFVASTACDRPSHLQKAARSGRSARTRARHLPLRTQLARAALTQRSLLPDVSVPVGEFRLASFYRPCEALAGDFHDLVWRRDCAVLLVADVMGHGLEAALITMLVKATFQEAATESGDPGRVLAGMDARLQRVVPESRFVAAAVARIDRQRPEIDVANAGLPHPLVVRAAEHCVEEVRLDGLPLALSIGPEGNAYDAHRLRLEPRDLLLMASDGIGSVTGKPGQCFEDHRMRETLESVAGRDARYVVERLVADAEAFGHGARLPDDVNLVAVARQAAPV